MEFRGGAVGYRSGIIAVAWGGSLAQELLGCYGHDQKKKKKKKWNMKKNKG